MFMRRRSAGFFFLTKLSDESEYVFRSVIGVTFADGQAPPVDDVLVKIPGGPAGLGCVLFSLVNIVPRRKNRGMADEECLEKLFTTEGVYG